MRNIQPGEQLTVTYIGNLLQFRQRSLPRISYFTCLCEACTAPTSDIWSVGEASHRRTHKVEKYEQKESPDFEDGLGAQLNACPCGKRLLQTRLV